MRITTDITTPHTGASAVALGFFDGVHLGHQAVLSRTVKAAREADLRPTVFTFSTQGGVPDSKVNLSLLQTEAHKEEILEAMGIEEIVTPPFTAFRELSPEDYVERLLWGALGARVLVCGENYRFGKRAAAGVTQLRALAQARGIRLITVPPVEVDGQPVSSTRIRGLLREGDVGMAARLLGAPFSITGEVVHGKRLGTSLHSPTINLEIPPGFTVPAFGVYLSRVTTPLGQYYGATNIGRRPTVEGDHPNCETFLLDFSGDLYGQTVTAALLERLRPERKFDSVDELSRQIQRDIACAEGLARQDHAGLLIGSV